jgi:predicted O-linked N-acetylglucosamine transferase (SPINDLY family)
MSDFERAMQLWRRGDATAARAAALAILERQPADANSLALLAEIHIALGERPDAIGYLRRLIAAQPADAAAHRRLAGAYLDSGDNAAAIDIYRRALALEPASVRAHNNLGLALARSGDVDGALASFRRALALDPDHPMSRLNLATFSPVLEEVRAALASDPDLAARPTLATAWTAAWVNHDKLLRRDRRSVEALGAYERALARGSTAAEVLHGRAVMLVELERLGEGLTALELLLAHHPRHVEGLFLRAQVRERMGDRRGAVEGFEAVIRADPGAAGARLARACAAIPALAADASEAEASRSEFMRALEDFTRWLETHAVEDATRVVGADLPFYLAYQPVSGVEQLAAHGRVCTRLMREWRERQPPRAPAASGDAGARCRLAIVSGHVRNHSVFNALTRGWITQLDRSEFSVSLYYLGTKTDADTELARSSVDHFEAGELTPGEWAARIEARAPQVLIYPAVGMDQLTLQLASLRLAPFQIVAWGHPQSSGLPTLDYYLSSEAFEPADADRHYTERLVRLPNLGAWYQPREVAAAGATARQSAAELPRLICAGTPFKYAPQDDEVLVRCAARLRRCRFVFFEYREGTLSRKLMERLGRRFAAAGLDAREYLELRPWASEPEFLACLGTADLMLDTIGFSGFNTVMQALECGLPVVTRRGEFMRGRFGSGILERLGLNDLVADDNTGYVDIVVRLLRDPGRMAEMRECIRNRRASLYRDAAPVAALAEFLRTLAARCRG